MNQQPDYGNWVPEWMFPMIFGTGAVLLIAAALLWILVGWPIPAILCILLAVLAIAYGIYMWLCHEEFAFGKGNMMADVHQHLVDHLPWDGQGTLLDIGCGAGALTIRCAKAFPAAHLVGVDYWGKEWNYAKEQCENNARIEGVAERTEFTKGDAAHLAWADETFDAAVSNFVFHEVRTASDKRDVVREALRVVRKGGAFSFQDLFAQQSLYGNMDDFVRELEAEGVAEIHYIGNLERQLDCIPGYVCAPWMISGVGILYGVK